MAISSAVSTDRVSRVTGYALNKGNFNETTRNLPQRIAILAEFNNANQDSIEQGVELTTAKAAAELAGWGSPLYQIMRILRPVQGGGVGSIPTIVFPQEEAASSVAAARTITVTGTATASVRHDILINGRAGIDGKLYAVDIVKDETASEIAAKINTAINNVLAAPVSSTVASEVVTATAKWQGASSEELNISVRTNGNAGGVTYAIASSATGSGTADTSDALTELNSNNWNTIIINSHANTSVFAALEALNGVPGINNPTGRYGATVFKPFVALFGNVDTTVSAIQAITNTTDRKDQVTNVLCPAPGSKGFTWEAAANVAALLGPVWRDNPNADVSGKSYPDMPSVTQASDIGEFQNYDNRDVLAKSGSSTVDLVNGDYQIQEIVTTYHPDGEEPPQFRYVRNLNIDWNIKFGLLLLEDIYVRDHAIAADNDVVTADKVIKPKQWRAIMHTYAEDLTRRNLTVEASFMQNSIVVATGETNPDRLESSFKYKRSPYGRVFSTTVEGGFATGLIAN